MTDSRKQSPENDRVPFRDSKPLKDRCESMLENALFVTPEVI